MQGYIIRIQKVKDEDLLVSILTENHLQTAYRFYGARHSVINLGYKIDFELQKNQKSSISMLRNVLHLSNTWLINREKMQIWQIFISLFYKHLKDVDILEKFYFNLLEDCSLKWEKQNPKRIAIEAYVKLLEFEGRLHKENTCFICENEIMDKITLTRGFLPAHSHCVQSFSFEQSLLNSLYETKASIMFDDDDIEKLWLILQEGL